MVQRVVAHATLPARGWLEVTMEQDTHGCRYGHAGGWRGAERDRMGEQNGEVTDPWAWEGTGLTTGATTES